MRAFTLNEDGEWVERHLLADSWSISNNINERSTANLEILDTAGTLHFDRGTAIRVERFDETTLFAGFIERATESRLAPDGTRTHTLDCVDLHYLADKRVIVGAWTNTSIGQIVRDIISRTLVAEGVTPGVIHEAQTLRQYTVNYQNAAEVLADLAERAGHWWRINLDGTLDHAPPGALPFNELSFDSTTVETENKNAMDSTRVTYDTAEFTSDYQAGTRLSFDLTDLTFDHEAQSVLQITDAFTEGLNITRHGSSYRNRQWIRGGADRTDPQVERFAGDGERRTFTVGFPVGLEPTVEVDRGSGFQQETVGVAGLQAGRQWTWAYRSHTLQQDGSEPVLTSSHRLRITYVGEFNIISRVEIPEEIATRRAVEGGTGIVEHVLEDKSVKGRDAGFERAGKLLDTYGQPAAVIRFVSDNPRYAPGRLADVTLPEAGLEGTQALVQTVEWFSQSGSVRCVVTAVLGPAEGTWSAFFGRLLGRVDALAQDDAGAEVDVVTHPVQFEKTWTAEERPNIWYEQYPDSGLFPGPSVVPAFKPGDRIKRIAWLRGGVEGGRVRPTQQTLAGDELVTITVLGVNDAIAPADDPWTSLAWFGGPGATDAPGSGIKIAEVPYVFSKTNVEQIQVTRVDRKWST